MNNDYFGWQINDMSQPLSQNVEVALRKYIEKNGLPEQILLETSNKDVPLPQGMNVKLRWINLPKNILLISKG